MRKENVVVTSVEISEESQIKFFQIKLPKTAEKIIGIEVGHRVIKKPVALPPPERNMPFKRGRMICDLKLQSCENANVFFSTSLKSDPSIAYLDFTNDKWNIKPYSHQTQLLEDPLIVDADSTILQGMIKDQLVWAEQETAVNYIVNIYVWLEMKK
jgi:hypothetical protein